MGVPVWKSRPSWFLVAAGDQAIPPDAERQFAARMGATTVEVPSNHVAMVSHPQDVLALIQTAAQAVQAWPAGGRNTTARSEKRFLLNGPWCTPPATKGAQRCLRTRAFRTSWPAR